MIGFIIGFLIGVVFCIDVICVIDVWNDRR